MSFFYPLRAQVESTGDGAVRVEFHSYDPSRRVVRVLVVEGEQSTMVERHPEPGEAALGAKLRDVYDRHPELWSVA